MHNTDTDPIPGSYTHILFNIIYKKLKLQFRVEIGIESSNFASEVIRAKEAWLLSPSDFGWLGKYVRRSSVPEVDQKDTAEMNDQVDHIITLKKCGNV